MIHTMKYYLVMKISEQNYRSKGYMEYYIKFKNKKNVQMHMCVGMVKNTHRIQNMHGHEKHQKLSQGKEGGEKNWEGICKGFKILMFHLK